MKPAYEDNTVLNNQTSHPAKMTCWRGFVNWFKHKDNDKWLEDMRGMLSLVSTMISSITFQASTNPPGGVFPASDTATVEDLVKCANNLSKSVRPCAGAAVLAVSYPSGYRKFEAYNTFCFVASLCVTLLLVSGVPLNHKLPIWILTIGMIFSLTSLAFTYLCAMQLISPTDGEVWTWNVVAYSVVTWFGVVGIVTMILTIRFFVWLVSKGIKVAKGMRSRASRN